MQPHLILPFPRQAELFVEPQQMDLSIQKPNLKRWFLWQKKLAVLGHEGRSRSNDQSDEELNDEPTLFHQKCG
jgi:hypothetical protein